MRALLLTMLMAFSTVLAAQDNPVVVLETDKGTITIELWADKAPISVENFLRYIDNGFFDGLIFHRVIPGFMVQGGGFSPDMQQKSSYDPIKNEVELRVPAGTAVLMHANVWHRASPTIGSRRRMLILSYTPCWLRRSPHGTPPETRLSSAILEDAPEELRELLGVSGHS